MTYRDDREALSARVAQLEGELDEARALIRRLRGEGVELTSNRWLGAPTSIELERFVEGEMPESAREEIIEVLRAQLGQIGRAETIGRTLAWRTERDPQQGGRHVEVLVTIRGGRTRVQVRERLGALAGGLFGGVVGGAGGGAGVPLIVVGGVTGSPMLTGVGVAWGALTYAIVRAAYSAVVKKRQRELARIATDLEDVVRGAVASAPVRARVELDASEPEEIAAEASSARREKKAR